MWLDHDFSSMRDYIIHSEHQRVSAFIEPEDMYSLWIWSIEELIPIMKKLAYLELKPEKTLDAIDIDDTLCSRTPQLQESRFQDNRWEAGNQMILDTWWAYHWFVDQYYRTQMLVPELVNILLSHDSLVLTAWVDDLQNGKIKGTQLEWTGIEVNVVASSKDKPLRLLKYIMDDLKYIPWKIIIYDDRVWYFKEAGPILSKLLWWIEVVVNKITLKESKISEIKRIDQTIYSTTKKRA